MRTTASAILLLIITSAGAQPRLWTLDECIDYAVAHNMSVRQNSLQVNSAELDITEAKDAFLPSVSAGASQTFNFGRGLTSDNTYADRNTSQTGWSVSLSLPLFQGLQAKRRLDLSRANLSVAERKVEAAKDDVILQVMAQYLQVLYNGEMAQLAHEQMRMSRVELDRRRTLLEAGKIPELDLRQAEAQLAQDSLSAVSADADRNLALFDLSRLMQLPDLNDFDVAPLSRNGELPLLPDAATVADNATEYNNGLRAARLEIDAADRQISLARTGYMPRLSFNAGLGSSYYNIAGLDNAPFHRQMRDNFNKSLGFTLSIPVFDAFTTRNSERKARLQKQNALLAYEDAEYRLQTAIGQAWYQADASRRKYDAALAAAEAARLAYEAMTEKYNYGRANATEYEQAKSAYYNAQVQTIQSRYETQLRIRVLDFYNSPRY
ncbi:MAG: TolC family protein [Paramuribaculum sp.]|nr:TolC family protein [Paramuribaculum sp.]